MTDQITEQLPQVTGEVINRNLSLKDAQEQRTMLENESSQIMQIIRRKLVEEIPDQEERELLRSIGEDIKDITPEELIRRETLTKMQENFEHDYLGSTQPLFVSTEKGTFKEEVLGEPFDEPIPASLAEIPQIIVRRTKNYLNETKTANSNFKISEQLGLIDSFFSTAISSRGNVYTNINYSLENATISANRDDFVSALVNVLNNSKREIVKHNKGNNIGINLVKDKDGNMILELFDDAGGFSDDMLVKTKIKTKDGREVDKGRAFMRNVSGSGSTGFGLDMVWETFVENMGCDIDIKNREFQYFDPQKREVVRTGKMGALTTIKFPKK